MGKCRRSVLAPAVFLAIWGASAAGAAPIASGTISCEQLGPDCYDYSLTLTVDPSSPQFVQTYWFAWIPGYDFLPSHPTSISSPAGWTGYDAPDTYGVASILWSAGNSIEPGQTLAGFSFTTPDPPSVILDGVSYLTDPPDPIVESFVYVYPDARGNFGIVIPTVIVPEPASSTLFLTGTTVLLSRKKSRNRTLSRDPLQG